MRRIPIKPKMLPPYPPIPTAFNLCMSVEEQIWWLKKELDSMRNELTEKGYLDPIESEDE